ncbi:MAG: CapA family protein [Raineya sp.]|nr:CapA family protein [Raineya sp.]MDW8297132.1 CapA family protein [Raineya sp.]
MCNQFQKISFQNHFPQILPYSFRGKLWLGLLKAFFSFFHLRKGKKWQKPLADFEENPPFCTREDIFYLGYKYYFQSPLYFPESIIKHFAEQKLNFPLPENFVIQSEITLSAGGDLMPYAWIQKPYTQHLWDEVGEFFFSSDIVFANLETPIHLQRPASHVPEVMVTDMLFNANAEMFEIFSGKPHFKGFDVLSTANNHSLDMGEEGIFETIQFLESQKVAFTGTARNSQERNQFPILERKGIKIAFIAYTYSLNREILPSGKEYLVNYERLNFPNCNMERLRKDVENAHKRGADIVVLSLHTGNAYQMYPSEHTIQIYHRIFKECGVDIILGSHPHNPQPMEKYEFLCPFTKQKKQGFAIYSLADFVAYDIFVWDRLIPLLKLHIIKGMCEGKSYTQISRIEVLPTYLWGSKKGKKELRFLNLENLIHQIQKNKVPAFMSKICVREALHLYEFWQKIFVPNLS